MESLKTERSDYSLIRKLESKSSQESSRSDILKQIQSIILYATLIFAGSWIAWGFTTNWTGGVFWHHLSDYRHSGFPATDRDDLAEVNIWEKVGDSLLLITE